jgi:mRNA interferase YafQ
MLDVVFTTRAKRDIKLLAKRGKDLGKLVTVIDLLALGAPLPQNYCDHQLKGSLKNFRECHLEPDWLLIYRIQDDLLILTISRSGTHSDLFGI